MAHIEFIAGHKFIQDPWDTTDVMQQAEAMGIELTEEQAEDVLDIIVECFDANIGINWDVIGSAIDTYMDSKEQSK